jgi:hypothetical protein
MHNRSENGHIAWVTLCTHLTYTDSDKVGSTYFKVLTFTLGNLDKPCNFLVMITGSAAEI